MGVEDHFDSCLHRFNGYDRGMLPRRYWFKITQSILKAKADATKNWFNVKMQISEDYHFDKRAIFYWAKLVTEELSEEMRYKELIKTISINILDCNFIPDTTDAHRCYNNQHRYWQR